jgi:hypothetical protein
MPTSPIQQMPGLNSQASTIRWSSLDQVVCTLRFFPGWRWSKRRFPERFGCHEPRTLSVVLSLRSWCDSPQQEDYRSILYARSRESCAAWGNSSTPTSAAESSPHRASAAGRAIGSQRSDLARTPHRGSHDDRGEISSPANTSASKLTLFHEHEPGPTAPLGATSKSIGGSTACT